MTKKAIEEKVLTEILKCNDFGPNSDSELEYSHAPMAQGTYQDGLIFALELLQGRKINK